MVVSGYQHSKHWILFLLTTFPGTLNSKEISRERIFTGLPRFTRLRFARFLIYAVSFLRSNTCRIYTPRPCICSSFWAPRSTFIPFRNQIFWHQHMFPCKGFTKLLKLLNYRRKFRFINSGNDSCSPRIRGICKILGVRLFQSKVGKLGLKPKLV